MEKRKAVNNLWITLGNLKNEQRNRFESVSKRVWRQGCLGKVDFISVPQDRMLQVAGFQRVALTVLVRFFFEFIIPFPSMTPEFNFSTIKTALLASRSSTVSKCG
jgi:hypothetical protein